MKDASFAKEFLSYAALGAGVLYAFGWGVRFAAVSSYGVGTVSISKESALATAVAALFTLSLSGFWLVCLLMVWSPEKDLTTLKRTAMTFAVLGFLGIIYTAFLMGFLPTKLVAAILVAFLFQVLASFAFLALRKVLEDDRNLWTISATTLIGLVMFVRAAFPVLPEEYGGMGQRRVEIQLKNPAQVVQGTLVSSDDHWLLVAQPEIRGVPGPYPARQRSALMLPADRVVEIVSIGGANKSSDVADGYTASP